MPPKRTVQQKSLGNTKPFPGKGKGGATTTLNIPMGVLQKKSSSKQEAMVPAPGQVFGKGRTVMIVPPAEAKKMQARLESPRVAKAPASPKLDPTCAAIMGSAKWLGKNTIKSVVFMFSTEDQEFSDKYIIGKSGIASSDKNRIVVKMTGNSPVVWRKGGLSFQKLLCDKIKDNQLTLKGDMLSITYGDAKKVRIGLAYSSSSNPSTFQVSTRENNEKMIMVFQSREKQITHALKSSFISWPWANPMQDQAERVIKLENVPYKEWLKIGNNVISREGSTCSDYAGFLYKYIKSKKAVQESKSEFSQSFLRSVVSMVHNKMDVSLKSISDIPFHNLENMIFSSSDLIHYRDLYDRITNSSSTNIGQFVDVLSKLMIFLSSRNQVTLRTSEGDVQLTKIINLSTNSLEYIDQGRTKYVPKSEDVVVDESNNVIPLLKNNGLSIFRERVLHGVYSYDALVNSRLDERIPEVGEECSREKEFIISLERNLEHLRLKMLSQISGILNPTTKFLFDPLTGDMVDVKNCVAEWKEEFEKVCRTDVVYNKIIDATGECHTVKDVLKDITLISSPLRRDIKRTFRVPPKQKVVATQVVHKTKQKSKAEDKALDLAFAQLKEKEEKANTEKLKLDRERYALEKKEQKEQKKQRIIQIKQPLMARPQVRSSQIPVNTGMNIMNRQIFNQFASQMTQNPVFVGFDMERM
jgi:hypothetical protein